MDFFEAQERARKRTGRLVLLFALAVLGTILAGYLAAMLVFFQMQPRMEKVQSDYWQYQSTARWPDGQAVTRWWHPQLFLWVAGGTLAVVGLASLFKWSQFRVGGSAVADSVGARPLNPRTTDLRERRLLNVVEEMAIASGVPMPAVYVMDDEAAINAFAAGLTTSDAVVAVTRGTLEKLNRDELQGVVAHEFSHILNGDMRLNVRLTAILFGILVIGLIGRGILRGMMRGRVRVGGDGKGKGGAVVVIFAVGLALLIIGYVGYFFGRLIQAAVSRQREFLADASAVQFTRNPGGIGGALKKIGGYALGARLQTDKAAEIGHFFFGQAFETTFAGLWATHPPLPERIRAVEPNWDGKVFDPPAVVDIGRESFATAGFAGTGRERLTPNETLRRLHEAEPDLPPPIPQARLAFKPAVAVAQIGALTESHFRHAQALANGIPARLRDAAHDSAQAPALVFALLFDRDAAVREKQRALVEQHAGAETAQAVTALRPALSVLDPAARLPLLQLTLPALRQLDRAGLDRFVTLLDELVHADARVSPFEYALQKMLVHHLRLAGAPSARVDFHSFHAVATDVAVVLSTLARLGPKPAEAFAAGRAQLNQLEAQLALLDAPAASLEKLDTALDRLALASPPIKQRLLIAAAHVVGHDGTVSVDEGELLRAISSALDCPMPPLQG
jgi:Zn-dependent protease with chaperone function